MTARRLDRTKGFGKIAPPMDVDGCPRPAYYEQDGILFDAHDLECVTGAAAVENKVPAKKAEPADDDLSVSTLLRDADQIPWPKFLKSAKRVLGSECPSGKAAIVEALRTAVAAYEARRGRTGVAPVAENVVDEPDVEMDAEPVVTQPPPSPAPMLSTVTTGVDLAAWARGQKDYLFSEVRNAVRKQYSAQLSERRDVVNLLVEAKVIAAHEARRDV